MIFIFFKQKIIFKKEEGEDFGAGRLFELSGR